MTAERKRVPEVHLEIVRRLSDANKFRPKAEHLPIPSRSTIYREIERKSPYEVMVARYGKRCAEMEFRVSGIGPETSRALQRVSMDHTPRHHRRGRQYDVAARATHDHLGAR